jgi:predicted DNA-binding transcriptional regulator AlpA
MMTVKHMREMTMPPTDPRPLLSAHEVATRLALSRATVYRLAESGRASRDSCWR